MNFYNRLYHIYVLYHLYHTNAYGMYRINGINDLYAAIVPLWQGIFSKGGRICDRGKWGHTELPRKRDVLFRQGESFRIPKRRISKTELDVKNTSRNGPFSETSTPRSAKKSVSGKFIFKKKNDNNDQHRWTDLCTSFLVDV